jgi:hypothetical protein
MTDDSVKDLLGRALGEEPPLRIDRDEVVQQGRKRLRRRRFLEAGSVVAAVLVAAVGAATLTRLAGTEPERLPPAASSQQQEPSSPASASATPSMKVPKVTPDELTALLYEFGIMTANGVQGTQNESGEPGARMTGDQYLYEADVVRPHTQGQVRITITALPAGVSNCAEVPESYGDCVERVSAKVPVTLAHYEGPDGQRHGYAATTLDNGLRVEVTASNRTSREAETSGVQRAVTQPVLTDDEICAMAVKAGLGV